MNSIKQKNFLAGLIFVAVLIFALAQSYRADSFSEDNLAGYPLYAKFANVGGLNNGAPVLLAGVQIGRVIARDINPDNLSIQITMDIFSEIGVPIDSSVGIVSDGIFGGKYLSILPGAEYDYMVANDEFDYISNSVDVMGVLETVILSAEKRIIEK